MYTIMDGTKLATWLYYVLYTCMYMYVQQVYELHTVYNSVNDYRIYSNSSRGYY